MIKHQSMAPRFPLRQKAQQFDNIQIWFDRRTFLIRNELRQKL